MIVTLIVRAAQLLFSVVVLALSITAIRWQVHGSAPASSGYNAFAGAWGILTTLIGIAALFASALPGLIIGIVDLLAFVILLAGGIAYAVAIKGIQCTAWNEDIIFPQNSANPIWNAVMNGGTYWTTNEDTHTRTVFPGFRGDNASALQGRCQTVQADTAFLFLACLSSLAAGILVIIAHRRGGDLKHSAV